MQEAVVRTAEVRNCAALRHPGLFLSMATSRVSEVLTLVHVHDTVFPVKSAGQLLGELPAEQPGTKSYTVATLFTQLLLHAGSLRIERQHTLIAYSHSDNLGEIQHTHPHTHTHTESS